MITFKEQKSKHFCQETVSLFSDEEWNSLLRRNGFDFTKKITYHGDGKHGLTVKQWDLPRES